MKRTPPPKRQKDPPQVLEPPLNVASNLPMAASAATNQFYYDKDTQILNQQHPGPYLPQTLQQPMIYYNQSYPPLMQLSGQQQVFPDARVQLSSVPQVPDTNYQQLPELMNYEWQTVVNNNRKRRISSPEQVSRVNKQTRLSDYWLNKPVEVQNRFNSLGETAGNDNDDDNVENNSEKPNVRKPPPIFVTNSECIQPLTSLLDEIAKDNYTVKALYNNEVKIQPKTAEMYTKIVEALKDKKTELYTYKPKAERPFRVVLKNVHPATEVKDIKEKLEEIGHEAVNVWNIKQRETKIPLPMFYVDLKPKSNNGEIYKIRTLGNLIVTFEPPHVKREIPQCMRCQRYGHTKNFCTRIPRCVKCTDNHPTSECTRKEKKNDDVKCVNCHENHPANYRGCLVHKQLQQKIYPTMRKRTETPPQLTQPTVSYAQATETGLQRMQSINNVNQNKPVMINTLQNNDMAELKEMIKQLINQMGTMMNLMSALITKPNTANGAIA